MNATLTPTRTCTACAIPASVAPLASAGPRLLCADCIKHDRISACRVHIATAVPVTGCYIAFQRYQAGLARNLEVLESCDDDAWWSAQALAGTGWLLTYGAAEVLLREEEYVAATGEEDVTREVARC